MIVLKLLAAYGLCFALMNDKTGMVDGIRRVPCIGPRLEAMVQCSYCTGFHCGWLVWLLTEPSWQFGDAILWAFASAAFCYGADTWVRWHEHSDPDPGS